MHTILDLFKTALGYCCPRCSRPKQRQSFYCEHCVGTTEDFR